MLLVIVGYAFIASFYRAPTAVILWQSVFMTLAIAVLVYCIAKPLFYRAHLVTLICSLPEQLIFLQWKGEEEAQGYRLDHTCRYGFLGFWLTLKPNQHSNLEAKASVKQHFFIPRFLLSANQISRLSVLIATNQSDDYVGRSF